MSWAVAAPNLLIGLREGLEAGLVVSILLAALRKTAVGDRRVSSAPVWLGVLGAATVAGSFAAVLTYSTNVLSSRAQEALSGLLSVVAVGLVTGMVFWMRRTAAGLSAQLRGEVGRVASIGSGALALTAFLAVGREGLETTLFLWTAVRASGQTVAPLAGAALGLAAAVALCWLLYQRAVRLNLAVFFSRTAVALMVIAAGVLSYGLGDLQDAGWLPGVRWVAFNVTAHVDPGSWWVSIVTGVSELSPKMTVLQVAAWAAYLVVVIPAFVAAGRNMVLPPAGAARAPTPAAGARRSLAGLSRLERLAGRRPWAVAGVLVVAPVTAAAMTIATLPSASAASTTTVTVTRSGCAGDWTSGHTGSQTFMVDNKSAKAGEVNLDNASGGVVADLETLAPGTTADMAANLGSGTYTFRCYLSGQPVTSSGAVQISGATVAAPPAAVAPVTSQELRVPNAAYQAYVARSLTVLAAEVHQIRGDLQGNNVTAARTDWLSAQLDWERVGASYDSFGVDGLAIDGLPDGLSSGVGAQDFTGLHRLEYGLWHGQSATSLLAVVNGLSTSIASLHKSVASDDVAGDPTNLPIRAHEILEDALRDHLSGIDDLGGGAAYPETYADLQVTRVVLAELAPLIAARSPTLLTSADRQMDALQVALDATKSNGTWVSLAAAPLAARQQVDAAIGGLLETLSSVPDLLEVPPSRS